MFKLSKASWIAPSSLLPAQSNSHFSLDDVGVDLSDSVDGVRSHDAQVRHVHPLASLLFDQRHLPQLVHVVRVKSCDFLQATQSAGGGGSGWSRLRLSRLTAGLAALSDAVR